MKSSAAPNLDSVRLASSAVGNYRRYGRIAIDPCISKSIVTIDFEASCLPCHGRSYPIEVGIANELGSRAWLIRPHPSWNDWDWSEEAEHLHGITLSQLFQEGSPVDVVAEALGDALSGHRIISDSDIDGYWLETLTSAAGLVVPAKIEHIEVVLDEIGASTGEIITVQSALECDTFEPHRARHDARWLFALIESLANMSAAR